MRGKPWWILGGLVSLWSILPVSADWLVLKDGTRVETRGAWKVKGSQVIFTLPKGALSSLRVDDVDLDASAVATTEAKEKAAHDSEAAPDRRPIPQPVATLTNDDIALARPTASAGDTDEVGEEIDGQDSSLPAKDPINVEVVSWNELDTITLQGVEIRGTVRNKADTLARELILTVTLFDSVGEILTQAEAFLGKTLLQPGAATEFRALFPGVTSYSGEPGFQIRGRGPLYGEITGISDPRNPDEEGEGER